MRTNTRNRLILAVLLTLGLSLSGPLPGPSPAYAAQEPPLQVTAEQLESINTLSAAFRAVAKTVRPSVVSIRVKTYPPRPPTEDFEFGAPGPPAQRRSPQEYDEFRRRLREFFGPDFDFFDRRVVPKKIRPRQPTRGLGSGVIVDARKGYILTNYHVIEGADEIQVKLHNGYRYAGKELGHDARADLTIVQIDAPDLQQARLGSSAQAQPGDIVLAVGSPWGLEQTVTQGIISAKGRSIGSLIDRRVSDAVAIQTDAAVNPGNSGGPLVNVHGEVIGINRAIRPQGALARSYAGVVFAVPIDHAKKVMEHIISGQPLKRGFLGVYMADLAELDYALTKSLGIEHRPGVMVTMLPFGLPA
ncbi:MAG: trypsin-like peptidase domain-containing protein, partial [Phycisphaerae bacterium]|nr:trypsin-like peptidase domain-containing protein [Phycisphaerae bacterium]